MKLQDAACKGLSARLSAEHPSTLACYTRLGVTLRNTGRYDEAIRWHQKVLTAQLQKFPAEHGAVTERHIALGLDYAAAGQMQQAQEHLLEALDHDSATQAPFELASMRLNIAKGLWASGLRKKALELGQTSIHDMKEGTVRELPIYEETARWLRAHTSI